MNFHNKMSLGMKWMCFTACEARYKPTLTSSQWWKQDSDALGRWRNWKPFALVNLASIITAPRSNGEFHIPFRLWVHRMTFDPTGRLL
jgi:hypothetical protein